MALRCADVVIFSEMVHAIVIALPLVLKGPRNCGDLALRRAFSEVFFHAQFADAWQMAAVGVEGSHLFYCLMVLVDDFDDSRVFLVS